jgi:dTDP-4-amino-4,6-dideoxygalactose transaminase
MIPQAAPALRVNRYRHDIDQAVAAVLGGRSYILGETVERFENAFAVAAGSQHCVGVGSGTDALALGLRALAIGVGDEVITTALTAPATAQAILQCGASLRFADVDAATRCIDPDSVAALFSSRTTAIVAVHLHGHPCDLYALAELAERHGVALVEDCAQSHGAMLDGRHVGTFGAFAAYSFYPTKNLGCIGDGGAVVTDDAALADKIRCLRNYGFTGDDRISRVLAYNSRLDEIQAAILLALLPRLAEGNEERRQIAARYRRALSGAQIDLPVDTPGDVYHQFAITSKRRNELAAHLRRAGIATAVHYTPPLHHHPAFASDHSNRLPVTETLADTLLSLPIQPEVAGATAEHVAAAILGFTN